jgi:hypothetical protein
MKKLFLLSGVIMMFLGCERRTDWPLQIEDTNLIVVDGIITNENKLQSIHITQPVSDINELPKPVNNATVIISSEDSTYYLIERPINSGMYESEKEFSAILGKNYSLIINYDNKVYTAKTYMVRGFGFQPLVWMKNMNNNLFHIAWGASPFNYKNPAMWEVFLDWSNVPGYVNLNPDSCKARLVFYTLPTVIL